MARIAAEVDILVWQDLVVDEEVAAPVVGQAVTVHGVGLLARGHPLQRVASGAGTVVWSQWDELNRLLWTVVRTPAFPVLVMDTLVIAPRVLPAIGDVVEYAGYLHVVHGYMLDDLGPLTWQDLRSSWKVNDVQRTARTRDFVVRAVPGG